MMNRTPNHPESDPAALGRALRNLPGHTPQDGTWQRIRARAERNRRRRRMARTVLPLALAASLLVALGVGHALHQHPSATLAGSRSDSPAAHVAITNQGETLDQLQEHSMRLERWLAELRTHGAPLQGRALASAVGLQDRIGLVDLQLAAPGSSGDRRALWQQRIRLLQDLAMLRATQSPLSARRVMAETSGSTPTEL